MKQIYKATDGTIFESKRECLEHEFNLKGGTNYFESLVQEAVKEFESFTGLKVKVEEAKASIGWDGDPNTIERNYVEWQEVDLVITKDGRQIGENYSRGSQGGYTKEYLIENLTKEYYAPFQKLHEGVVEEYDDPSYYSEEYVVNGVNVNDILRANFGKRVRIEVLE
ncbi:hypothetical protein [Bacillus sp. AG4(2022)]|uniref:hypothetical protein n=1 Tax=Bacillus sp. AG4(2022) TaxID=2962594 RepID=UPI0028817022|nr:hypothetical protein [Bacillus sp. AG4(2022)]MDT0160346.1 hypothetical protein [Bacillus sp. AG4(2022)]